MNFFVEHVSLLALGHLKQVSDEVVMSLNALLLKPPNDVGTTLHVADTNHLL